MSQVFIWPVRMAVFALILLGSYNNALAQLGKTPAARPTDSRITVITSASDQQRSDISENIVATTVLSSQSESTVARSFTGTLMARRNSELGYKRIGRIEELSADQGDRVRKGELLALLDTADLEAEVSVLKAQKDAALARLDELIAGPRKQSINAARAQMVELEAIRDQLKSTFQRRQQLANSDAISKQDIDDARHLLAAAEAKIVMQGHTISELVEGTRKEQIAAQQAEVARLEANIKSIDVKIADSKLLAPYNAIVSRRMVDEGAIVQPGVVIFKIIELAPLEAWIGIPPDVCASLSIGDDYPLTLRGKPIEVRLKAIMPELDAATRTQTAIFDLALDNEEHSAPVHPVGAVGEIASLNLVQTVDQKGFWLPVSALTRGVKGLWSVFVVVADANAEGQFTVERRDVQIVQVDSSRVLIDGTVMSGDRVVTSGVQKLTPGQRVQILDEPHPAKPQTSKK